jgi:hypothetical protein
LEADKAAGEAKAHEMAAMAYGTIIVLLIVVAGIGAFTFVARQRNGHFLQAYPRQRKYPIPSLPTSPK